MSIMNRMTREIQGKILKEELSDEPPKKFSRVIATLAGKDEFLFIFYSEHVLWEPQAGINTCGVRPYGDGQHIIFSYDPAFIESLPKENIYFLLAHEVYHILQDHVEWEKDFTKNRSKFSHDVANIAMDTWINTDLSDEGSVGGFAMAPPFAVYGYRKEGDWGDVEKWVNDVIEKATKKNPGEKFDGPKIWDSLYDWVEEMFKKYGIWNDDDDDDGPEPPEVPVYPQVGSIIKGPNGQYGQVIEIDSSTKKVTKIEPISQQEAYNRVRGKGGIEF